MIRRSIQELIARYDSEPTLGDLYVEGPQDTRFYEWVFDNANLSVRVFPISDIHVDGSGNKHRVITLCESIESELDDIESIKMRAICDNDLDSIVAAPTNQKLKLLLHCDFYNIESYFIAPELIEKVLRLNPIAAKISADKIVDSTLNALIPTTALRASMKSLGIDARHISVVPDLALQGREIVFNADRFIDRTLHASNAFAEKVAILDSISTHEDSIRQLQDLRAGIDGKDALDALAWYIRSHSNDMTLKNAEACKRVIGSAIEFPMIKDCPAITSLLRHFGS